MELWFLVSLSSEESAYKTLSLWVCKMSNGLGHRVLTQGLECIDIFIYLDFFGFCQCPSGCPPLPYSELVGSGV